jgi:Winged helix DNA-binding domain
VVVDAGPDRERRGGLLHAADPPPRVDHDEALAILGARYRAGYGPCDAADLAKWSSLPITQARRALDAAGPLSEPSAWPVDDPPPCLLLAAFDTLMLGYRTASHSSPPNTTITSCESLSMQMPALATRSNARLWSLLERAAVSPGMIRTIHDATFAADVPNILPLVRAPVLVLRSAGHRLPEAVMRRVVDSLPNATFQGLSETAAWASSMRQRSGTPSSRCSAERRSDDPPGHS